MRIGYHDHECVSVGYGTGSGVEGDSTFWLQMVPLDRTGTRVGLHVAELIAMKYSEKKFPAKVYFYNINC